MTVIWGLDLHDMQWGKFRSSYMFNRIYHLRRTKMVVYQLAMILCVCSEAVGTAALSDYLDQQSEIQGQHPGVKVHNNDFIGAASYNIFAGISVAFIFGGAFFFDLFWPERHEDRGVKWAWKICAVVECLIMLGSALTMTVITARNSAYITGTDAASARRYWNESMRKPALSMYSMFRSAHMYGMITGTGYRTNPEAVASVVLAWPGAIATIASTVILFMSQAHDGEFGPKSGHGRSLEEGNKEANPT